MRNFSDVVDLNLEATSTALLLQSGYLAVTNKRWMQLRFSVCLPALNLEVENTDAVALFALINAAVARADHDALPGLFFPTEINHGVGNRRIALDRIRAGPKKQIARFQVI